MSPVQKSSVPIRLLVALLTVSALTGAVDLQTPQTPPTAEIDAIFAQFDESGSVGCALGVAQDGELVYKKGYGSANLDWDIPITPTTVFYVGSVAKQFTAAAIALLADEGKLDLDDDIRTYLPEFPARDPAITIRHLVHHTSGIPGIWRVMQQNGHSTWDRYTRDQALELLGPQELDFEPGDRYRYSNGGYFSLAMIVERASGQSLREYTTEKMFEPLGMSDTHFHDDPVHIVERRALSYQARQDGDQGVEGKYYQSYQGNFAIPGPGGLYTTVEDLLQWERNFRDNKLGSPRFMQTMYSKGVLNSGAILDYAFGITEGEHNGLETIGHGGSYMGFQASFVRFPEQGFATWVLCNMGSIRPSGLGLEVADLFLAEEMRR